MIVITLNPARPGCANGRLRSARRRACRGITIIETLVLMTGLAAILGLCALMLQLLMKLDGDSRTRLDDATQIARLSRQFRQDVHQAHAARLLDASGGKASGLRIEPAPDRSVEYRAQGDGKIVRVESKQGSQVRRESYEIHRAGPIRVALAKDGGLEFATLTLSRQASRNRTDPPRALEILALVGKNRDRTGVPPGARGDKP
jgi:hypothetical protein